MNLKQIIRKVLNEEITKHSVICDECGWSWKLSEGGNDPYVCHKCGNDNSINESIYTRRRLSPEQMDRVFEDSIKYTTNRLDNFMRREKKISVHMFENMVTSIMMDEFHGELSNWGLENFPYDEVYNFIKERYSDKIRKEYKKLYSDKSEMIESELTEKCWPGYTQKGMKTMFGKRYPNCVKKKK